MDKAKNVLQEWAQQHGVPLPIYESQRDGPAHRPSFKALCHVSGQEFRSSAEAQHASKKDAEKSAAQMALLSLQGNEESQQLTEKDITKKATLSASVLVIVDADNVDVPLSLMQKHDASFLLFVARNGSKSTTDYEMCDNAMVFTCPCIGKDATDIYLTYETKGLRDMFPTAHMAIYTKDHFAQTLACIAQGTHVCNLTELREWLQKTSV